MTEALHTKYRPRRFSDVIGQDAVVTSLTKVIERRGSQAFLFSGPAGTGKTTLARISARSLGSEQKDTLEIDGATYTGIDAMRQIQETLQYKPFGDGNGRAIIIDECHRISKQAWDSLLKSIEKPPPHVVWFFCTTEPSKVPDTIKTRCTSFTLKPVSDDGLLSILQKVCTKEVIKLTDSIRDLIIREAHGSPRQLLVNLELCRDVSDRKAAADILRTALETDTTIELCRFLVQGGSWTKATAIISRLEDENPESVRYVVCNYIATVLKNAGSDKEACRLLRVLQAFSGPYDSSERQAPLLLSVGRVLFNGE